LKGNHECAAVQICTEIMETVQEEERVQV